jgi:hypothetical protein
MIVESTGTHGMKRGGSNEAGRKTPVDLGLETGDLGVQVTDAGCSDTRAVSFKGGQQTGKSEA